MRLSSKTAIVTGSSRGLGKATAEALPGIIRGFKARGFRFVTIGEMLGIDGPVPFPAPQE